MTNKRHTSRNISKKHLQNRHRKQLSYILIMALILGCIPGNGYGFVHTKEHDNIQMANTDLMVNDYISLYVHNTNSVYCTDRRDDKGGE